MSARIIYAASVVALLSACSQATHTPPPSAAFVAASLGYEAYKSGDLGMAASQFQSALAEEPDNAYALLGLGAVRENQGDLAGAIDLYNAAQIEGRDAPTRFAYFTEQRLERASSVEVASLAKDNLERIYLQQASLTQGAQQGFVSYDGETAGFAPIEPAAFTAVESYTQPPQVTVQADAIPSDGNYVAVGSYETYASSLGGAVVESSGSTGEIAPLAYNDSFAQTDASFEPLPFEAVSTAYNSGADAGPEADYSLEIEPATYTTVTGSEVFTDDAAPYYDAPLSNGSGQIGADLSQYQSIGDYSGADAGVSAVYTPVAESVIEGVIPEASLQVRSGGPVAPLLGYGEAFGGDAGFATPAPAPASNTYSGASASATATVRDAGGLIYLGDG